MTLELVLLKLNNGVSEQDFMQALQATQSDLKRLKGFIRREVFKDAEGLWVDMVYWQTREDALAAAQAFMTMESAGNFASKMNSESVQMLHLSQVETLS